MPSQPLLCLKSVSLPRFVCRSLGVAIALSILNLGSKAIADTLYTRGSQGCPVTEIQRALGEISVDGDFGDETLNAVRNFQTSAGLADDGVVGPDTLSALGLSYSEIEARCGSTTAYSVSTSTTITSFDTSGLTSSTAFCDRTRPYVVAIPGRSRLSTVQRYYEDARVESSRLGSFVCAGSFARRSDAEERSNYLQRQRVDARVEYRP